MEPFFCRVLVPFNDVSVYLLSSPHPLLALLMKREHRRYGMFGSSHHALVLSRPHCIIRRPQLRRTVEQQSFHFISSFISFPRWWALVVMPSNSFRLVSFLIAPDVLMFLCCLCFSFSLTSLWSYWCDDTPFRPPSSSSQSQEPWRLLW
jgi:hypothetical protein